MAVVGSALVTGWNIGVTNPPENYIKCWIQAVQKSNESLLNGGCEDAPDLAHRGELKVVIRHVLAVIFLALMLVSRFIFLNSV